MAITLVRKNSDTPNIRNTDDARMVRYSTYGKSGIIKSYGEEIALSQASINTLHIGTGEIVHQGWQVTIDGSGVDITLDNRDTVEYYTIYLEINLAVSTNQTASILLQKANNAYPTINPGDDLTQVPTGTSRLEIAHIYLEPGQSIFNIIPLLEIIEYDDIRKVNKEENYGSRKAKIVNHGDYINLEVEDVNGSIRLVVSENTGDHSFDIQVEQYYNGRTIQFDLISTLNALTNKHLYRHTINWENFSSPWVGQLTFILYLTTSEQLDYNSLLTCIEADVKFPVNGYVRVNSEDHPIIFLKKPSDHPTHFDIYFIDGAVTAFSSQIVVSDTVTMVY